MSLIQLLKLKKWEKRLFKVPCLEMPHFQTRTMETVASGFRLIEFSDSPIEFSKYATVQGHGSMDMNYEGGL